MDVSLLLLGLAVTAAHAAAGQNQAKPSATKSDAFVEKCRSHCVAQLTAEASQQSCLVQEECLRCWASCKAFQSDHYIRDYCKRNKACTSGCRQACLFYLRSASAGAGQAAEGRPLVVGLDRDPGTPPGGHVYSLVDGKEAVWKLDSLRTQTSSDPGSGNDEGRRRWTLRLGEVLFGSPLVSATVTWEPRGQGSQYLATWELMSGGLRGHLVSTDTSATLPLWPDEEYVVQVFSEGSASEPLQLSTRRPEPAPEAAAPPRAVPARLLALLLLLLAAGGAAAVLAAWRERRRRRRLAPPAAAGDDADEDADAEADRDDRRTLLARSVLKVPPQVLADPRSAPVFIVPRHKR